MESFFDDYCGGGGSWDDSIEDDVASEDDGSIGDSDTEHDVESKCSRLTNERRTSLHSCSRSGSPRNEEHDAVSQAGSDGDEEDEVDDDDDDDYPPLDLNDEAIKHVATYYLPGNHGKCTNIMTLSSGSFHEIRVLHFEDGWSCVGRFTRNRKEQLRVMESEYATVKYVREHTDLPVPEIYFVNFDPNHAVGAAFTIVERLPGAHLYNIWDELSTEHKKAVLKQITDVMVKLAELKFSQIGSLRADGTVGEMIGSSGHQPSLNDRPFTTTEQYLLGNMPHPSKCTKEMNQANKRLKRDLLDLLEANRNHPALCAPYRLIHSDLDAQNMLVIQEDKSQPPVLTGIIDWDYTRIGLLYDLMEYPIFIQDVHWSEHLYEENKILRKYFVRCLADAYPKGSWEREDVKDCFRMKDWLLQNFDTMWADEDTEKSLRRANKRYDPDMGFTATPYEGRLDWEPDSELESDDEDE